MAALGQAGPAAARPLLLAVIEGADSRTLCAVLHQLAHARDPALARRLLDWLLAPEFAARPAEEQRAILMTLAAAAGDDVLPELEAELCRPRRFAKNADAQRQALARCVAQIATPAARQVLERGLGSRHSGVRKACEEALTGGRAA